MISKTLQATGIVEGYESLRALATGEGSDMTSPRGLALFLRQGMAGWMEAWSRLMSLGSEQERRPVNTTPVGCGTPLPAEVATILASMALSASGR